jgi:hypothetical protein
MVGHALAGEVVVDVERFPLSRVEEAWQGAVPASQDRLGFADG